MIVFGDEFEDVIKFNYTTPQRKQSIHNANHILNKKQRWFKFNSVLYITLCSPFLKETKKRTAEYLYIF